MNFISKLFSRDQRSQAEQLIDAVEDRYALSVRSETIDEQARSVIATAATESRVPVIDFSRREIVDEILVAEGGSFPARMPMLDSHNKNTVFSVLGGASNAVRNGTEWDLRLEFDTDQPSERAFQKVQKGYITDVSVGYRVTGREYVEPGRTKTIQGRSFTAGERPLKVATKWAGRELSVTPIGADRQAKIRSLIELNGFEMKKLTLCPAGKRGDALAAELNDLIDDMVTDSMPRESIVDDMGSAAGIESGTVNQILSGSINCPPLSRLEGFASALDVSVDQLIAAAEQDGCQYG